MFGRGKNSDSDNNLDSRNEEISNGKPEGAKPNETKRKPSFQVESLEPRILMSATWADVDTGAELEQATDEADAFGGTEGADQASGFGGNDLFEGLGGDDSLFGDDGDDTLLGGSGDDLLVGGTGDDTLEGDQGNDLLRGDAGEDILSGGDGDDILQGGADDDILMGDAGNDLLVGDDGNDDLFGDRATLVISEDFEDGAEGWNVETTTSGDSTFTSFLGPFAGTGGNQGVHKTFELPANVDEVVIEFDFRQIDSWDGESFKVFANDSVVVEDQYRHGTQGDYANAEFVEQGFHTGVQGWYDQTYRYRLVVPVVNGQIKLGFGSTLDQAVPDEAWGIDNLKIYSLSSVNAGSDSLSGGAGADMLVGGGGDDQLSGGAGNDRIFAGTGNDTVQAGDGNDNVDGGAGNDWIDGGTGADRLSGGAGDDVIYGGTGNDNLSGGVGNDLLEGGADADRLDGGEGNDTLRGGDGEDVLLGGAGNDLLDGGYSDDQLDGGLGDDTLIGGFGNDRLVGGEGNDNLAGDAGDDSIDAGTGNDIITAGTGNDRVFAGSGNDTVDAGSGDDLVLAGEGNDSVTGGSGNDQLVGGGGDDELLGGIGNDRLIGDGEVVLVSENFEEGASGWSVSGTDTSGSTLGGFLGRMGGTGGNEGVYKDFAIPEGVTEVTIEFDFHQIDSWDGENFKVFVDGEVVTSDSYAHGRNDTRPHAERISSGYAVGVQGWMDQTYRYRLTVPVVDGELRLGFGSTLDQAISDESWGIDNLKITTHQDAAGGNDRLDGGEGDDELQGGGGDDLLIGGAGTDTAVYDRGIDDYQITRNNDGSLTIVDTSNGATDRLESIEQVRFNGQTYEVGNGHVLVSAGNSQAIEEGDRFTLAGDAVAVNGSAVSLTWTQISGPTANLVPGTNPQQPSFDMPQVDGDATLTFQVVGTDASGNQTIDTVMVQVRDVHQSIDGTGANDNVAAGDGNDIVVGGAGNDTVLGGTGNDVLAGDQWIGSSVRFDAQEDALTLDASGMHLSEGFTVAATVKLESHDAWDVIFEKVGTDGRNDLMIGFVEGKLVVEFMDDDIWEGGADPQKHVIADAAQFVGNAHHFAYTYEAGSISVYADGQLLKTIDGVGAFEDRPGMVLIGADTDAYPAINSDPFNGEIGNVQIYSRALSIDEVRVALSGETAGEGVVAHYDFAGDQPFADKSGHGLNLTPAGTPTVVTAAAVSGDDALTGNQGDDVLIGGAGDDLLVGDGKIVVVEENFENGAEGWNVNTTTRGDSVYTSFLGPFAGTAGNQGVFKTFEMPEGATEAIVEFDFRQIDSWDGEAFKVFANDAVVVQDSFRYGTAGSYEHAEFVERGSHTGVQGWVDQTFRYRLVVPVVNGELKLGFGSTLDQAVGDEGWGIDNLKIITDVRSADGDDVLIGGAGNDTLVGGGGDDVLRGGTGTDKAVFVGAKADYEVVQAADGSVTVTHRATGEVDTLSSIEELEFDDVSLSLEAAIDEHAPTELSLTEEPLVRADADAGTVITSLVVRDTDVTAKVVAEDALLARWTFDGAQGLTDVTGHGHNGLVQGNAELSSEASEGGTLATIDASSRMTLSTSVDLGESWTISAQFKGLAGPGSWGTLTRGSEGDHQVLVHPSTGELGTYDNIGGTGFHGSGFFMTNLSGDWHDVTAVGAEGQTVFYVNGVEVGAANYQSTSNVTSIGNYLSGTQRFADELDDVQIHNRALSADEIRALHAQSNDSFTFEVTGPDAAKYEVVDEQLVLKAGAITSSESGEHQVTVRVTDSAGLTIEREITIPVVGISQASGAEDAPVALDVDLPAKFDQAAQPITITVAGVPEGASLNVGTLQPDGTYSLTPAQLEQLQVSPPADMNGSFELTITARSVDADGDALRFDHVVQIEITEVNDAPIDLLARDIVPVNETLAEGGVLASLQVIDVDTRNAEVAADALVLRLTFDGAEVGADGSGSNANALFQGGAGTSGDAQHGTVATFSDQADRLTLTQSVDLGQEWTISAEFQGLAGPGSWGTLTRGSEGDHQVLVHPSTGELGTYDNVHGSGFHGSGFFMTSLDSSWHDVTAVGKDGNTVFYIDGVEVGTANFQSTSNVSSIGNYLSGTQRFADALDDVQIHSRALSPAEIARIHGHQGDTFQYEMVSGDASKFELRGNELVLRDGASLDFSEATEHTVTVRVTDAAGESVERSFTIPVTRSYEIEGVEDSQLDADLKMPGFEQTPETVTVSVSGLPSGARFDVGTLRPNGTYEMTPQQLESAKIELPADWSGSFRAQVVVHAFDATAGEMHSATQTFHALVEAQADAPTVEASNVVASISDQVVAGTVVAQVEVDSSHARPVVGADSLLAEWTFDSNANASSANIGNAGGKLLDGANITQTDEQGGVASFYDQGDRLNLDRSIDLGESWTISAEFKGLAGPGNWGTLTRGSEGDHQILVHPSTGELGTYDNVHGSGFHGSGFFMTSLDSDWHAVTAVGTEGATTFFVDGVEVGTADYQSTSNVSTVGNYLSGTQRFADQLDDVRIHGRALSASEVAMLHRPMAEPTLEIVAGGENFELVDGQIVVRANAPLDFEAQPTTSVTVRATSPSGQFVDQVIEVPVTYTADAGDDRLVGTAGNDQIQGFAGDDVLAGGAGDDLLVGDGVEVGQALQLDGVDDYVDTGHDFSWSSEQSFSISASFVPSSVTGNEPIVGKGVGIGTYNEWEYTLMRSGSSIKFVYWNTGGGHSIDLTAANVVTVGQECDCTVSFDSETKTAKLFVNGEEVVSGQSVGTHQNRATSTKIGMGYVWGNDTLTGSIADVQFHNKALSLDEVGLVHEGGVVTEGLAAHYDFEGSGDEVLADKSGNGLHATMVSNPTVVEGGQTESIGDDRLEGGAGDDVLVGGRGDDLLVGGEGTDTAVYSSSLEEHRIERNDDGSLTIVQLSSGDSDRLEGVETLRFNGVDYQVGSGHVLVSAGDDLRADEGSTVQLTPSGIATDGGEVTYTWTQIGGPTAVLHGEPGETIFNADFEEGSLDGARQYGFNDSGRTIATDLETPSGGDALLIRASETRHGGGNFGGTVFSVPAAEMEVGKTYRISYWVKSVGDTDGHIWFSNQSGSGDQNSLSHNIAITDEWQLVERDVTLNAAKPLLYCWANEPGAEWAIDDLKIEEIDLSAPTVDVPQVAGDSTLTFQVAARDAAGNVTTDTVSIQVRDVNQTITGTSSGETIDAADGNDIVNAGAGNDVVLGGSGNDRLDGGEGNDRLLGGMGNDQLIGNLGDDQLSGGQGVDRLSGGAGNDSLYGQSGDDTLEGGSGDDLLVGDGRELGQALQLDGVDDYVDTGHDFSWSSEQSFSISASFVPSSVTGNEPIVGKGVGIGTYNEWEYTLMRSGSSIKFVYWNTGGGHSIDLTAANVVTVGQECDCTVSFDSETKTAKLFVNGEEVVSGQSVGTHQNRATSTKIGMGYVWGNDTLTGSIADVQFHNKALSLDEVGLVHEGGVVTEGLAAHYDFEGSGDEVLADKSGNGLHATMVSNPTVVEGGSRDGVGNDSLSGGSGDDRLEGGFGDDLLDGGEGNDIAVFTGNFEDYEVRRDGETLILHDLRPDSPDGTDRVVSVETLRFADGEVQVVVAEAGTTAAPGAGRQILMSRSDMNTVTTTNGGAGDDIIFTNGGKDWVVGGDGNDTIIGSLNGLDWIEGGAGADAIDGGGGHGHALYYTSDAGVNIDLAAGTASGGHAEGDTLTQISALDGSTHDDVLTGGAGHNWLRGMAGDDRISGGEGDDGYLRGDEGNDVIDGGSGTDTAIFTGSRDDYQVIQQPDGSFQITDRRGIEGTDSVMNVEFLQFADGRFAMSDFVVNEIEGTRFDDTLAGTIGSDLVRAGEGNDLVLGGRGDDQLLGEAGNDTLVGGAGYDSLDGGDGDDVLVGDGGEAVFDGSTGRIVIEGSAESLSLGRNESFTLEASFTTSRTDGYQIVLNKENSYEIGVNGGRLEYALQGPSGGWVWIDTGYRVTAGEPVNVVLTYGHDDQEVNVYVNGDRVPNTLPPGPESLHVTSDNLQIGARPSGSHFAGTISNVRLFASEAAPEQIGAAGVSSGDRPVADFRFDSADGVASFDGISGAVARASGGVTIAATASGNDTLSGGAGNDTLIGGGGADQLSGGTGNDSLLGGAGNDSLDGGEGNDRLVGGTGNDVLNGGSGDDVLSGGAGADQISGGEGTDVLSYSDSSAAVQVDLSRGTAAGGDATGDVYSGIEGVVGTRFNDTLIGDEQNNLFDAGAGNDRVDAGAGNDLVIAGAGADLVYAGSGNDVVEGGQGDDRLHGEEGNDQLRGGAGSDQLDGGAGNDQLIGDDAESFSPFNGQDGRLILEGSASGLVLGQNESFSLETRFVANRVDGYQILLNKENSYEIGINDGRLEYALQGPDGSWAWIDTGYRPVVGQATDIALTFDHETRQVVVYANGEALDRALPLGPATLRVTSDALQIGARPSGYHFDGEISEVRVWRTALDANEVGAPVSEANAETLAARIVVDADAESGIVDTTGGFQVSLQGSARSNDRLDGGAGDDSLHGMAGDDLLIGGAGNDVLDGGRGNDTALFSGSRSDYSVTRNADGDFIVRDLRGADGEDLVRNVERFQFADGEVDLANVVDQAPVVTADVITASEGERVTLGVSASDANGDRLTYQWRQVGGPVVALDGANAAAPTFAAPNQSGNYQLTFEVVVSDGHLSTTQTVSVDVTADNDGPVVTGESYQMSEDQPLRMTAAQLLANDRDIEGTDLRIASVQDAEHGSVRLLEDGSVEFVPAANYSGPASFTYTVADADGATSTATVELQVMGVADAASIDAQSVSGAEDQTIPLALSVDLSDTDGSETVSVVVRGVPEGARLTLGTEVRPGVWSVPAGQIGEVGIVPPADFSGEIELTVDARVSEGGVVFADTFNGENQGQGLLNDFTLNQWTVTDGSVDVIGAEGFWNLRPGNGLYLDLDGSTGNAARLTLSNQVILEPGVYELAFDLSGNARGGAADTVSVSAAGGSLNSDLTLAPSAGFNTFSGRFVVTEAQLFDLTFDHRGGDNVGLLLDNIRLVRSDATEPTVGFEAHAGQVPFAAAGVTTTSTTFTVEVEARADEAVLSVQDISGTEDQAIALPISVDSSDVDGSEATFVRVSGVPEGGRLNAGQEVMPGIWQVAPEELSSLALIPPVNASGEFTLVVDAVSREPHGPNLVVNGSFENHGLGENTWGVVNGVEGWSTSQGAGIEIQSNVAGASADGDSHVELDSHDFAGAGTSNSGMMQQVAVTEGSAYRLSFAYSPRPGVAEASNGIEVWWNGQLLETVTANGVGLGQTSWTTYSFDVPADSDVGQIEFRSVGTQDSLGGYVDQVSLQQLSEAVVSEEVHVTIAGVADDPTMGLSNVSGFEDQPIALGLNIASSDADGSEQISVTVRGVPAGASLDVGVRNLDGSWTLTADQASVARLTPAPDFNGQIALEVTATSTEGNSVSHRTESMVVEVVATNDGPEAIGDRLIATEDSPLVIAAADLLGNDRDIDGDQLRIVSVGEATNGSVSLNPDGSVRFVAAANYSGDASFSYTVVDAAGAESTATVQVSVTGAADAASIVTVDVTGDEDQAIPLSIAANYTDLDGSESMMVVVRGVPEGGSLSAGMNWGDGSWHLTRAQLEGLTFTPPVNAHGEFELEVVVVTTEESSEPQPVIVGHDATADAAHVDGWNSNMVIDEAQAYRNTSDAPQAMRIDSFDFYARRAGSPVTPFVVAINGDNSFTVLAVGTSREPGSFALGANQFRFSDSGPTEVLLLPGQRLAVGFLDARADGTGGEAGSVIPFDQVSGAEIWHTGAPSGSEAGSVAVGQAPGLGSNELTSLSREYHFNVGFTRVEYSSSETVVDSLTVTAAAVNDAAVTVNDSFTISEDQPLRLSAAQLLANDSDVDGDQLQVTAVSDAVHGNVRLLDDGSVEFVPQANFSGQASFSYTVTDAAGVETTATVSVEVYAAADAANLVMVDVTGNEEQAIPLSIRADFADADGSEQMSVVIRGVPEGASLSAGVRQLDGSWKLEQSDLAGLTLTPATDMSGAIELEVVVTTSEREFDAIPVEVGHDATVDAVHVDGWNSNMVIDEAQAYRNETHEPQTMRIDTFNFFARRGGSPVTPFVVAINADNSFTVLAVGTSREPGAFQLGANSFAFSDGGPLEVELQPGQRLAVGFLDARADGTGGEAGSVIPFDQVEGAEIWHTGAPSGTGAGSVTVGQAPGTGTHVLTSLTREYRFNVGFSVVGEVTTETVVDHLTVNVEGVADGIEVAPAGVEMAGQGTILVPNVNDMPQESVTVRVGFATSLARATSLVSYAASGSDNEFLVFDPTNVSVYVGGQTLATGLNMADGQLHDLTVSWESETGRVRVFDHGVEQFDSADAGRSLAVGHQIRTGGTLVLGQEQDSVGGGFDASQAFHGRLTGFEMFAGALEPSELRHAEPLVDLELNAGDEGRLTDRAHDRLVTVSGVTAIDADRIVGSEDRPISLPLSIRELDTDGSESLSLAVRGVPVGVVIGDGAHRVVSTGEPIDLSGWNLHRLSVTPIANSSSDFDITLVATATEADGGDTRVIEHVVHVDVQGVADGAEFTAMGVGNGELVLDGTGYLHAPNTDLLSGSGVSFSLSLQTSDTSRAGTLVSYAVPGMDNEFLLYDARNLSVYVGGHALATGVNLTDGQPHEITVSWDKATGAVTVFDHGQSVYSSATSGRFLNAGHQIVAGGSLVIGQEQDSMGGAFDASQAFVGRIGSVSLWSQPLTGSQMSDPSQVEPAMAINAGDADFVEQLFNAGMTMKGGVAREHLAVLDPERALTLDLSTRQFDADGSESLRVTMVGLQAGTQVTDGRVTLTVGSDPLDVSTLDRSQLQIVWSDSQTQTVEFSVVATTTEVENGSVAATTERFRVERRATDDSLVGTSGADRMFGYGGNDVLTGGAGNDLLDGGEGDDLLAGGRGSDQLIGGAGHDTAAFDGARSDYRVEGQNDGSLRVVHLTTGDATLVSQVETLRFADGDVALTTGTGAGDLLAAISGNAVVVAGAGDDQVNVGQGTHQLFGGEGNDTVSFGDLTEGMTIDLRAGQASGNGVAATLSGFENVIGSQGNDRIVGDSRTNLLDGGAGDDVLQAGSSDDVLLGGEGNDTLYGEAGFDRLDGGAGDDRLHADQFDEVMGGEGYDRVLYDQAQVGVTLDMGAAGIEEVNAGSRFADTFIGGEGDDRVYARQGDDLVFGGAGNDQLNGQEGNDTLVGDEGNDTLDGGVGDDLLMGGSGSNRLIGGEGIDTVWYGDAASGVTVDLTLGRATHDGAADVLSGIERVVGSEHDDTFRFERPMNGASYDVFAGAGHNVLDLSRFTTDQLTIEPGKVIVNFAAGQSFSITHHGIEQIVTASGTMENINVQSLEMLAFPGEATVSGDVLLGAFDIDGDQLSVSAFTQPANGKVSFDGAGRFTYQPASGFFGVDRFSFTVSDPAGHQVTRFIDVTVPAPIAGVDFVQDDESGATNKSSSGSSSSTDSTLRGSTSLSNQGSSDSQTVGSQTSDSNDVVLGSSLGAADNGAAAGGSGDGDSGSRLTESTEELERLLVELADSDNLLQEAGVPLGVEQLASLLASLEDLHPGALETLANLDSAEMADRLAQDPQLSEALSSMGDRSEFAMQAIVGTLGGMLMGFVGLRKPKEESEERGPKKVTRTSGDQK